MPSTPSTPSTPRPDASFDGVSPIDFIDRWILSPSEHGATERAEPVIVLTSTDEQRPRSALIKRLFFFYPQATTASSDASLAGVLRGMCYRLLAQIPDEGLDELYQALERIKEFYSSSPEETTPAPKVTRVPAKMGRTQKRPDFYLDEE